MTARPGSSPGDPDAPPPLLAPDGLTRGPGTDTGRSRPPATAPRTGLPTAVRRCITVPALVITAAAWICAAPVWAPVLAVVGAIRRRRMAELRFGAMIAVYLGCEVIGVAVCVAMWIAGAGGRLDRDRYLAWHTWLQQWWSTSLLGAAQRIFGFRLQVEGGDVLGRGPYLLLLRHASVADTMLGAALATGPHGIRLRYVLKRELLWDPCVDIAGHRLRNCFVDRKSDDSKREIERVAALADDLGPNDGVLIYPEGTRFSRRKQARVLAKLRTTADPALLARAESYRHILPPRLGGALALLERARGVDVVFCAHTGFESTATLAHFWNGAVIGQTIRVACWRVTRTDVPDDLAMWLFDQWARVDDWVGDHAPHA